MVARSARRGCGTRRTRFGSLTSLGRLHLHNNLLTGPIPAQLASLTRLTALSLARNDLTGAIPAGLADLSNLATLDLRDNPFIWPPPSGLSRPRAGLTAQLPGIGWWVPATPTAVSAEPADGALRVTWTQPGAGTDNYVDTYTLHHRRSGTTGDYVSTTVLARGPAAEVSGLSGGVAYDVYVTAANSRGTSPPSATVTGTPRTATETPRVEGAQGSPGFSDVSSSSVHYPAIAALANADTFGVDGIFQRTLCGTNKFCPRSPVLRRVMAVWLTRALDGVEPSATTGGFDDVPAARWWNPHVKRLVDLGVTSGCSARRFCPDSAVTRAQMAVFLVKAFSIPNAGPAGFADVPSTNSAYGSINALYASGITLGCSQVGNVRRYCPNDSVTRDEMATFISRACTRYPSTCTYDDPPTVVPPVVQPPVPHKPTDVKVRPSPGTAIVTWKPASTGPAATSWQVHYSHTVHETLPLPRDVTVRQTRDVASASVPSGGLIIRGLTPSTEYTITVQGLNSNGAGTASDAVTVSTPPPAVRLVALEITQGLQNWNGEAPRVKLPDGKIRLDKIHLVKGKTTVVRAFLEPTSGKNTTVNVKLYATSGGRTFGPVSLVNADSHPGGAPSRFNPNTFTTSTGVIARRGELDASANFELHAGTPNDEHWIGDADDAPSVAPHRVTYRLEVDEGVICDEALATVDTCTASVEFIGVKQPRVRIVGIKIPNDSRETQLIDPHSEPTREHLIEQAERIESLMPIPRLRYELIRYNQVLNPAPSQEGLKALLDDLLAARTNDGDTSAYLGVMLGSTAGGSAGSIPSNVAVWYTGGIDGTNDTGSARNRGSHEFGHVIGEYHAAYKDYNDDDYNPRTMWLTICSGIPHDPDKNKRPRTAGTGAVKFDYIDVERKAPEWHEPNAAFLGPMMGTVTDDAKIWGFDTRFVDGSNPRLAVINPSEVHSVMSYCRGTSGSQRRWIDAFYHQRFIAKINAIDWEVGPGGSATGSSLPGQVAFFSGHLTLASDGSASNVTVRPAFTFAPSVKPLASSAGDYLLELLAADGRVLRSVTFGAHAAMADYGGSGPAPQDSEFWVLHVADPPDYAKYRISRRSKKIAEVTLSAAAPTVTITSPTAGQVLSGDTVEFSWSGSDPDGDDLSYLVQYSVDGGATYETIAVNHSSATMTLDRGSLPGSSRARLRVVASDGARSATAESAVFSVPQNPPEVFIRSPAAGAVYGGLVSISLRATAYDTEDGGLDASAIRWSSSIDGSLATGGRAYINTGDLSVGTHVITASAADSSSLTGSATVTVTVHATNDPPAAVDDSAFTTAGRTVSIDVTANDTDNVGDIDASTLRIVTPPALGTATIAATGTAARIEYTSTTSGFDVLIYEICDSAGQCATAEVTIIVSEGF